MKPLASQMEQEKNWEFAMTVPEVQGIENVATVKNSQALKPLFEFSGACAGCGETPYVKLVTQLFGDRMIVANATGCSSIYGGSAPTCPYTTNNEGHGPAWANSLFEDNAEFGFGMNLALQSAPRQAGRYRARRSSQWTTAVMRSRPRARNWLDNMNEGKASKTAGAKAAACRSATTGRHAAGWPRRLHLRGLHAGPRGCGQR